MSNLAKMYWLTRLDYLHGLFLVCSVLLAILSILFYFLHFMEEIQIKRKGLAVVFFGLSVILLCLVPTKDEMIFIYAGGKTMDFVQSDSSINKLPSQTTKIISDYLDKEVKSLKKNGN